MKKFNTAELVAVCDYKSSQISRTEAGIFSVSVETVNVNFVSASAASLLTFARKAASSSISLEPMRSVASTRMSVIS